jgi:hypothetical protein
MPNLSGFGLICFSSKQIVFTVGSQAGNQRSRPSASHQISRGFAGSDVLVDDQTYVHAYSEFIVLGFPGRGSFSRFILVQIILDQWNCMPLK